jgi:hypothetical protein
MIEVHWLVIVALGVSCFALGVTVGNAIWQHILRRS